MSGKRKLIIIGIFILLVVFLNFNRHLKFEKELEKTEIDSQTTENSNLAILVEKEDGTGYEESDTFVIGTALNEELSGCINDDGNKIDVAIKYLDGKVNLGIKGSIMCYLYFDRDPAPLNFTFYLGGNSNPTYTTSINVGTYLSWSDTDIAYYCITNTKGSNNCTWKETIGNMNTPNHTLTTGDGTKKVYAYIKDMYGSISPEVSDTIILDTSAPTSNSIKINNNATYTTSTSVTLTLSSTGAKEMCISNTSSCSSWTTYSTSKSHTLAAGDGTKTVYVWYRDEYGNTTSYVTDTIILDTAKPTSNSVKINNNATYTTSTSVTLTLSSTGASQMCISNTSSCSSWITYSTSKSWTLTSGDGTKTVYVWFRDAAGNTTSYVTDTIILDTNNPTVTASASNNNTSSPKVTFSSNEAGTYCVNTSSTRTNMNSCVASGSISANSSITTGGLSVNTYYVHVKDGAGNVGVSNAVSLTKANPFGAYLKNAKTTGFNSNLEGGLYRYQGTSVNNYICFGTSNKNTCLSNTDAYMYRIIGVNSSDQVKLIKNEALNNSMKWNNSMGNYTWPNSTLYSAINGSSFLTNTTYVPSGWSSKIATYTWKYGDTMEFSTTYAGAVDRSASSMYSVENSWSSVVNAKIALMYVHDYYYAYQSGGLNCSSAAYNSECKNAWLHISKCDATAIGTCEWLMPRLGYLGTGSFYATHDMCDGYVSDFEMNVYELVRPVFFLTSSVQYVSGTGTSTDPFVIN